MNTASERYSRHEPIPGWNQATLSKKSVVVIGSDRLADFILVDLISIGCGSVKRIGYNEFLPYTSLNPEILVEQQSGNVQSRPHAEYICEGADMIIEASNNTISKKFIVNAAAKKGIPLLSSCAGKESFSVHFSEQATLEQVIHPELETESGLVNGLVASAISVDELRKYWMPRNEEKPCGKIQFRGIRERDQLPVKVLQVGAGAIGTTTALALALLKSELTIVDFDRVEESNLTRQFLFYDSIGQNKAEALREKLKPYTKIHARTDKIERGCSLKGYDVVFSCVDNHKARYAIHETAMREKIPVINGGSSVFAGSVLSYMPGKTACLDCQSNYALSRAITEPPKEKPKVPGRCFEPSLLLANQIVGGLMVHSLARLFQGRYEKAQYQSGYDVFLSEVASSCFDGCTSSKGVANGK